MPGTLPSIGAGPETDGERITPLMIKKRQMERSKSARAEKTRAALEAIEAGFGKFEAPLRDAAAEHAIYVEETVETFRRKDEILEKRLVEERARREQISVSFLSLLKDMTVELEAHCNSQRRQSYERLNDRFAKTAARLSALQERIPRECEEMVTDITKQTDELF